MPENIFNSNKIFKIAILAIFLLSWCNSTNATVICECEEGHITVENIYTGYCNIDLNHDHSIPDHSDLNSLCKDKSINLDTTSAVKNSDFNFTYIPSVNNQYVIHEIASLDQNYIAYILSKERLYYNIHDELNTIRLVI